MTRVHHGRPLGGRPVPRRVATSPRTFGASRRMIALTTRGSAGWLCAHNAQAAQARRQAECHRRQAEIWSERAAEFEAEIAQAKTTLRAAQEANNAP